jgi:hypothetical protein
MRIRIPNPGTWQFHIEMRSFSDQLVASFRYQSVGGDTPAPLNIRLGMQRKRSCSDDEQQSKQPRRSDSALARWAAL